MTKENGLNLKSIGSLITGRFLTNSKWQRNWPFILFLSFLTLIMIASSHSAERKVHRISALRTEVKELSSQHIDTHSRLMNESLESKVLSKAKKLGLQKSYEAPILITSTEE